MGFLYQMVCCFLCACPREISKARRRFFTGIPSSVRGGRAVNRTPTEFPPPLIGIGGVLGNKLHSVCLTFGSPIEF